MYNDSKTEDGSIIALQTAICAKSSEDPDRVNNAVILSMVFDSNDKYSMLDQELSWLPQLCSGFLGHLLGYLARLALSISVDADM